MPVDIASAKVNSITLYESSFEKTENGIYCGTRIQFKNERPVNVCWYQEIEGYQPKSNYFRRISSANSTAPVITLVCHFVIGFARPSFPVTLVDFWTLAWNPKPSRRLLLSLPLPTPLPLKLETLLKAAYFVDLYVDSIKVLSLLYGITDHNMYL